MNKLKINIMILPNKQFLKIVQEVTQEIHNDNYQKSNLSDVQTKISKLRDYVISKQFSQSEDMQTSGEIDCTKRMNSLITSFKKN